MGGGLCRCHCRNVWHLRMAIGRSILLTAPRPIRPIDGNALLEAINAEAALHHIRRGLYPYMAVGTVQRVINNAPTLLPTQPEPVADGDAISREALLKQFNLGTLRRGKWEGSADVIEAIRNAPALPSAQPEAADVVTVEDVVEGIRFEDKPGFLYEIGEVLDHKITTIYGTRPTDSANADWKRDENDKLAMHIDMAVAMLNVAESISWPEGHRRNPKPKDPTLLEELLQAYEELHVAMAVATGGIPLATPLIRKVKAAIERERKDAGE